MAVHQVMAMVIIQPLVVARPRETVELLEKIAAQETPAKQDSSVKVAASIIRQRAKRAVERTKRAAVVIPVAQAAVASTECA